MEQKPLAHDNSITALTGPSAAAQPNYLASRGNPLATQIVSMGANPVNHHQLGNVLGTTVHHNIGQGVVVQQDIYRPPTPTRIRISANDSEPVTLTGEI